MKRFVVIMLGFSLFIAGFVSWFASSHPDGLERAAENLGFIDKAVEPVFRVLPDYSVPGLKGYVSTGLAGIIGVCATYGFVMLVGKVFFHRRKRKNEW